MFYEESPTSLPAVCRGVVCVWSDTYWLIGNTSRTLILVGSLTLCWSPMSVRLFNDSWLWIVRIRIYLLFITIVGNLGRANLTLYYFQEGESINFELTRNNSLVPKCIALRLSQGRASLFVRATTSTRWTQAWTYPWRSWQRNCTRFLSSIIVRSHDCVFTHSLTHSRRRNINTWGEGNGRHLWCTTSCFITYRRRSFITYRWECYAIQCDEVFTLAVPSFVMFASGFFTIALASEKPLVRVWIVHGQHCSTFVCFSHEYGFWFDLITNPLLE